MAKKAATKTVAADVYPPTLLVFYEADGDRWFERAGSLEEEQGHISDWSHDKDITHYEKFHLTLVETGTRGPVFTVKKAGV